MVLGTAQRKSGTLALLQFESCRVFCSDACMDNFRQAGDAWKRLRDRLPAISLFTPKPEARVREGA